MLVPNEGWLLADERMNGGGALAKALEYASCAEQLDIQAPHMTFSPWQRLWVALPSVALLIGIIFDRKWPFFGYVVIGAHVLGLATYFYQRLQSQGGRMPPAAIDPHHARCSYRLTDIEAWLEGKAWRNTAEESEEAVVWQVPGA